MTGIAPQTFWKLERLQLQNAPVGYFAACARVRAVSIEEVAEDELPAAVGRPTGTTAKR